MFGFIDRHNELERLERLTAGPDKSALVVLWGRRRVGKTRLLLEWARRHGGIYWVADEAAPALQRRYLAAAIAERFVGFGDVDYRDWAGLFSRLAQQARAAAWQGPFIIDELPYLIGGSPELPSVLQRFIDHEAKAAKLVVAVAGSSQRMMQGLVLDASAPLFGRATEILKLQPIPAPYLGEALKLSGPRRVVEAYSVWGGIPRYWELAARFDELTAAVESLVLDPLGVLHDEPVRLLLEEVPIATSLRPVLEAIGAGAHRVSEMAGRLGTPGTSLARPLQRLQELDLVARETPYGDSERAGKRALYVLSDPLMRLWFRLVAPQRGRLLQSNAKSRRSMITEALPHLIAAIWEELCRRAVPAILERRDGRSYEVAQRFWHGEGPEWDVVTQATDGSVLLLGEAKWTAQTPSAEFVEKTLHALVAKGAPSVRRDKATVLTYVVCVPELPLKKPVLPKNAVLVDAKAVLAALRNK